MEWIGIHETFVPEHYHPSTGFQDAGEFLAGFGEIEPVSGLRYSHEIHALVGERRCFGGSCNCCEGREARQVFFSCTPHTFVGFYPKNTISVFEEQFREDSSSGSDVSDDRTWSEAAFGFQEIEYARGIAGAKAHVVFHPGREALSWRCDWHSIHSRGAPRLLPGTAK